MNNIFNKVFHLLAVMLFVPFIPGQSQIVARDSVAITKPEINKSLYIFKDNGSKEIQIGKNKVELVRYRANPLIREFGNGALTALTGIGFSSSSDATWKISGIIQCNDTLNDWEINLFCEGYVQTDRERVKNDDGSWSVETSETNVFLWDKNASGIIIEHIDTVGFFKIIMNPREDTLLKTWSADILSPRPTDNGAKSKLKVSVSWRPSPGIDYGVIGKFRNKDFFMIRNGTDRKVWISIDNTLRCIFRSDLDYRGLSKKYRIMPYVLINNNIPGQDRRDLFRLSIAGCFLNNHLY